MSDDAHLQAEAADIERLLGELTALVSAPVRQRIDGLLRRIVDLYGAGLGRALQVARGAGADEGRLRELVCADELLGSLLVLHGLHPLDTHERVQRALVSVRRELDLPDDGLVLAGIEDDVVHLQARGSIGGGAMSDRVAEGVIRRVLEAAAPEIATTRVEGLVQPHAPDLVRLRVRRAR